MHSFDYKAIIFDLDGVLVESTAVVERHWREWADLHGLRMADIEPIMHGRRAVETMALVAPHLDIRAEGARFAAIEAAENDGLVAVEGARELLLSLPVDKWAVATSGTRAIALARLRAGGLPVPGVLVTADDVERGKPAPDAYLLAAAGLGVNPGDCVVFEDAPAGVAAAVAAGMRVIGVTTSFTAEDLMGAEMMVPNLRGIGIENGRISL